MADAVAPSPSARALPALRLCTARRALSWERLALLGVLALSTVLQLLWLDRQAYGNTYYAAAVKSMLTSTSAFFFAAFDGGGFVTVDKPPLGLWVQAASARLFGFSGPSILLPQAIAGVLSVLLIWWLVRRAYGRAAGLLAALALAVTPISVVTSRNNTMDGQLILALLLAAWAGSLAAERGRLRWLLLCAVLLGLAYNIKMLQAFLVLPALWLAYLACAPIRWPARLAQLIAATAVLLAVSLSWTTAVDLLPPDARPYVGSSGSNSALSLALGYNGLGRFTQAIAAHLPIPGLDGLSVDLSVAPGFAPGIGSPGLLRLFSDQLADQASWLLPLALAGLLVAGWQASADAWASRRAILSAADRRQHRRHAVALVIWGGWLAACLTYFSAARFYHVYYLIMLGPPVAALAGIGVSAGWRGYQDARLTPTGRWGWLGRPGGWLLPLLLLGCALVQARIVLAYPAWSFWLLPALAVVALAALVMLVRQRAADVRIGAAAASLGCLALLAGPATWSSLSVWHNNGAAWLPEAGPPGGGFQRITSRPASGGVVAGVAPGDGQPRLGPAGGGLAGPTGRGQGGGVGPGPTGAPIGGPFGGQRGPGGPAGPGGPGGQVALTFAGEQWNSLDPGLVQYLLAHQGSARFLVATPTSTYASLFILATDQPAMALGGYQGWDRILTPDQLAEQVRQGVVRFFWINGGGSGSRGGGPRGVAPGASQGAGYSPDQTADLLAWVRERCLPVQPEAWQTLLQDTRGYQLFDCGAPE